MATQQWKYHVFISFRGEDTRSNFLCHLNGALSRKGLSTFVDDRLQRGEEINSALLQAIQDSKVAVIIFSENYASSSWCLDELLKIIECKEKHNQIVIPVFYRVNPSDVRKQNGSFGESFKKQSENPRNDNKKIQEWKHALTKAADLSGWDSDAIRKDDALIDQIVKDISKKLEPLYPCSLERFVGLDSKIIEVKTLLATGSSDVRVLGIWGMGGIGKTTLAEAIFDQVSRQFEGQCFVRNVREAWKKGCQQKLLKELISKLLEQSDVKIDTTIIGLGSFLVERLKNKRLFVVFDDVSDQSQLEPLIGKSFCCFGTGSIIIITGRDKQVFEGVTDTVYNVKALSYSESHKLFVKNAFKQNHSSQDHIPLLDSFVNYARGNPLAIKVLGSYVCRKGVKLWNDVLNKLSKCADQKIQNVLKLSYDELDREQKVVFLHIACFFKGENIIETKRLLNSCRLSVDSGVRDLVDKSLVTISDSKELDMHDLLQEMGREIVRQESIDPGHRSRLWDDKEIRYVFEKNKGTEAIESIILNMSQIEDIVLDPDVFKRMPNLKFLRFYTSLGERSKVHLTRGLHFLPSELRYLYWDKYPLESLPTDFDAKELLVLHLPNSNIKHILKDGKDAGKLKAVAHFLIESPLMSRVPGIVFGKLPFGIGNKVPSSSCRFLSKITSLDMRYCQNLKSFPNNFDFQCLEILNVRGCSNLNIFPEISTNLRKLDVRGTTIKDVHSSSIEGLSRLKELDMSYCKELESLPSNICKLQALRKLNLESCSSLKKFPEILEPMYNLWSVDLSYSGIEVIPSSIDNVIGLADFHLRGCPDLSLAPDSFQNLIRRDISRDIDFRDPMRNFSRFSFSPGSKQPKLQNNTGHSQSELPRCLNQSEPQNLFHFEDSECYPFYVYLVGNRYSKNISAVVYLINKQLAASKWVYYLSDLPSHPYLRLLSPSYYSLDLYGSYIRELPKDLGSLYYLRELHLWSTDFEEIPVSIQQLSLLKSLALIQCPKLRSLPQLPASLCDLSAIYCESLKTLLAFKQPIFNGGKRNFYFNNCFKLETKECEAMAYKVLRNGPKVFNFYFCSDAMQDVTLSYSGNRIPEWFWHQAMGDTIRIKLPSNWLVNPRFLGFALCIVCDTPKLPRLDGCFECYFQDNYNPTTLFKYQANFGSEVPMKAEVLVWSLHDFNVWISENRQLFGRHCINMASFKFWIRYGRNADIKNCGITPLYVQLDEGYVQGNDDDYADADADADADEYAYRMLESLLPMEMSTKMEISTKIKMKKIKNHDEDMNSEDTDDDMIPEDDENDFFETVDNLFENRLSEANDELLETTLKSD